MEKELFHTKSLLLAILRLVPYLIRDILNGETFKIKIDRRGEDKNNGYPFNKP